MHIVVLTGAGISAESGIKTFRDSGGLWENHDVNEVASIEGWHRNRALVTEFYNQRRKELEKASPNKAHILLHELEKTHRVTIITQNVDNLHERAGSTEIVHLHGELTKARSTKNEDGIIDIGYRDILIDEKAGDGGWLRPHIVWFGEPVPMIEKAARLASEADLFLIIGTSLNVYPAAGLINFVKEGVPVCLIDPKPVHVSASNFKQILEPATKGMEIFMAEVLPEAEKTRRV